MMRLLKRNSRQNGYTATESMTTFNVLRATETMATVLNDSVVPMDAMEVASE